MKILVTGSEGYIGAVLCPVLRDRKFQVFGMDTGYYADQRLYHYPGDDQQSIRKDIRHIRVEDLVGFDAVVHLAELSNDPLGQLKPDITTEINHLGTVSLAQKCKQARVRRFVYTSSCSVYGVGDGCCTEQSSVNPQTEYARCKVLCERDVAALSDDDFSPVFLRNATAYGFSPRMRFDIVANNLAGLAWTQKHIAMVSDGSPWRPMVHVMDICEAVYASVSAHRSLVHNQIYNVGHSEENYRIRQIAELLSDAFPGCHVSSGPSGGDNRTYQVDFGKISRELDFSCHRRLTRWVGYLADFCDRIQLTRENFETPAYTRLKRIKQLLQQEMLDDHLYWNTS